MRWRLPPTLASSPPWGGRPMAVGVHTWCKSCSSRHDVVCTQVWLLLLVMSSSLCDSGDVVSLDWLLWSRHYRTQCCAGQLRHPFTAHPKKDPVTGATLIEVAA